MSPFVPAGLALLLAAFALWRVLTLKLPAAPDLSQFAARIVALESRPVPRDPDTIVTIRE